MSWAWGKKSDPFILHNLIIWKISDNLVPPTSTKMVFHQCSAQTINTKMKKKIKLLLGQKKLNT